MSRSDGESARSSRNLYFAIIVLTSLLSGAATYGQCPSPGIPRPHGDGVPDECGWDMPSLGGQEQMQTETQSETDCADVPADAPTAWEAYRTWAIAQAWGDDSPLSDAEQYELIRQKECELGLVWLLN